MFNMYFYNNEISKQYSYTIIDGPSSPFMDLSLIKEHLKLDSSDTSQDSYLSLIGDAAFKFAENYTRRTFLTTVFETKRDNFNVRYFELNRSPLQEVNSITYIKDNITETLPADFYQVITREFYSEIHHACDKQWPHLGCCNRNNITINFSAGYADSFSGLDPNLKIAMLNHVAKLYESRGDCDSSGCSQSLPSTSKLLYDQLKIYSVNSTVKGGC